MQQVVLSLSLFPLFTIVMSLSPTREANLPHKEHNCYCSDTISYAMTQDKCSICLYLQESTLLILLLNRAQFVT